MRCKEEQKSEKLELNDAGGGQGERGPTSLDERRAVELLAVDREGCSSVEQSLSDNGAACSPLAGPSLAGNPLAEVRAEIMRKDDCRWEANEGEDERGGKRRSYRST